MGPRDLELDHVGPEVVRVAVHPDLGGQPHAELVAALAAVGHGLDAQGIEVVDDVRVVLVLGEVADGEVHVGGGEDGEPSDVNGGQGSDRKIAGIDVAIDELQLVLYPLQDLLQRAAGIGSAPLEFEIGDQPAQPQHRR